MNRLAESIDDLVTEIDRQDKFHKKGVTAR